MSELVENFNPETITSAVVQAIDESQNMAEEKNGEILHLGTSSVSDLDTIPLHMTWKTSSLEALAE